MFGDVAQFESATFNEAVSFGSATFGGDADSNSHFEELRHRANPLRELRQLR